MKRKTTLLPLILGLLLVILTSAGVWIYYNYTLQKNGFNELSNITNYERHYSLIVDSPDSTFWQSVYESASEKARENGAYLELLGPDSQSAYTMEDMMRICIAESVDGILLQYTGESDLEELIDEAVEKNIPVITIAEDAADSKRQSFVGVNTFQMGEVYGQQVAALVNEDTRKVMVLVRNSSEASIEKLVSVQISNAVAQMSQPGREIDMDIREIESQSSFDSEETIRNIILSARSVPDILVCLDEVDTECAYQAVIDYNEVGKIDIVGYYATDTILEGISKNIIPVSIELNARQMGEYGIEALTEYLDVGRVSDYYSVDVNVITPENVGEYISEEEDEN